MKMLAVTNQGHVWHVPLIKIAENRADFYVTRPDPEATRDDEIAFVMDDTYEGIDWFQNNMNWSDISAFAVLVQTPEPLTEPEDCNDCEIVEAP